MNTGDDRAGRFGWEEGDIAIRHPVVFPYTRQELEALFRLAKEQDVEQGGRYDARSGAINIWSTTGRNVRPGRSPTPLAPSISIGSRHRCSIKSRLTQTMV
jgi:hypothetical protein